MTRVPASSTSRSSSSPMPRSASLPTETSLANPRPRAAPRDISVPSMVPDCEITLVLPTGGAPPSSTALTVMATLPGTSTTPMLLGPSRRTLPCRAPATRRAWRAAPSGPSSEKPSLKIDTTGMPQAPQSATARSTASPGAIT